MTGSMIMDFNGLKDEYIVDLKVQPPSFVALFIINSLSVSATFPGSTRKYPA